MPTPPGPNGAGSTSQTAIILAPSLESIVQGRLDTLAKQIPKTMSLESNAPRQETRLLNDIGEYLIQSAKVWAELSTQLVTNRPIERAIIQAHEISRQQTRLTDLSAVVALDHEQKKLLQIRDLTRKFSDDVQRVWEEDPGASRRR
ncbi:hypothetical protein B0T10DRAFT_71823 [Thelonectria olida]|uniref:Uncharacterized protein n=1 Tax=Thelonectria olida TaxID=1576542 RepID=A0A9P8W2J2_9HYPO|nr:hypothetical protein B0T10DRAFT_71823 [Thelonectria olida]